MAKKISALTAATTPLGGTELVEVVQGGVSKKVAVSSLLSGSGRALISSNRTYYVRTDGSNSNDGLSNTSGGAFLTIQKAVDVISSTLDIASGVVVTVQVADGTYTTPVTISKKVGAGTVVIQGNTTTPANCLISVTSASAFVVNGFVDGYTVKGFKIVTATAGYGIALTANTTLAFGNIDFGACASGHVYIDTYSSLSAIANYTISGSSPYHWRISGGYLLATGITITLSGTPAFSTAFLYMNMVGSCYVGGITFSGTATGQRYNVSQNAVCNTNGGGANYLPGNAAGSATGGLYV